MINPIVKLRVEFETNYIITKTEAILPLFLYEVTEYTDFDGQINRRLVIKRLDVIERYNLLTRIFSQNDVGYDDIIDNFHKYLEDRIGNRFSMWRNVNSRDWNDIPAEAEVVDYLGYGGNKIVLYRGSIEDCKNHIRSHYNKAIDFTLAEFSIAGLVHEGNGEDMKLIKMLKVPRPTLDIEITEHDVRN